MNQDEKALVDAARKFTQRVARDGLERTYRESDGPAGSLIRAALDAFPADAEPQPETVRDVADLRDGETVLLFRTLQCKTWLDVAGQVRLGNTDAASGTVLLTPDGVAAAVAAGAVTRPSRAEPDPADVERLAEALELALIETGGGHVAMARRLLRSGEITLRDPS